MRALLEGGEQLVVDVVEPAVRHHDDQVAAARLRLHLLHNPLRRRHKMRGRAVGPQIGDDLFRREPLVFGDAIAEHRREHHFVGSPQRVDEVLLEDLQA